MIAIKKPILSLATSALVAISALSAPVASSNDDPSKDVDKLMIVDCMLPGKVMRLGGGARYMSARRPTKTTGADCEIRGGEYVAYDRANYATSLQAWLPDAKAGDPKAQTYVGEMFEQGLGTSPDFATAVAWYRKAAEQGYDRAQMNLGSMYERGLGVEKNELEALNWYRKATGMGDDDLVLASEVEALEVETEELRAALAESEAEVARLKESLSTSRQQVNNSEARLTNTQMELEEMRFRAAQAQSYGGQSGDVNTLNAEIQQKEQELAANRKELMDLRINFDRQKAQFTQQLSAQPGDQGNNQALLDLEREKISSLESQVSQLTGNLQSRQAELANSNAQLASLRMQLEAQAASEQKAADESISELTQMIESPQADLSSEQLATLNRQLEAANERRANSEKSLDELSRIIEAQQADLEQKTLSISFLEQELLNQKQQLSAERTAYERREQGLLQSVDMATLERQNYEARLAQTEAQMASYQQKLVDSDRQIQTQQSEIVARQTEIERLEEEKQRQAFGNSRALEARLGDQNIDLARSQGENAALRTEINAMESELSRLRNQVAMIDTSDTVALRGVYTPAPVVRTRPDIPDVDFGEYHALIIGNNSYSEFPSLTTPINDARAMEKILKEKYGFKTRVLINADRYTILQTLNNYRETLTDRDNFLLYYAGHGTLDEKNNRGHWLPVDASPNNPANWISNVTITDYINTMSAKHIMVIADSCYSGTMAREVRPNLQGQRSKKLEKEFYKRLAQIASRSALTSGGTQPVMDGGGGDHSIFAKGLLNTLESNNSILQGPDLFLEVHQKVSTSSNNAIHQVPAFDVIQNTGDLGAPFFFVPS